MTERKDIKRIMGEVRKIFNEWDFLGVAAVGPLDEYDYLTHPVSRMIIEGSDRETLKKFIEGNFGPEGNYSKEDLEKTLNKLEKLKFDLGSKFV